MNILVISNHFEPELTPRSFRTTELVKGLVKAGNNVTLYLPQNEYNYDKTVPEHYVNLKYYYEKKDTLLERRSIISRIIRRIGVQFFSYPDISIMKSLPKALRQEKERYDLLITVVAPHSINWAIANEYRKGNKLANVWVADCGDPFMLEGNTHIYRPFWFKMWEKRWCSLCDYISVPHVGAIQGYYPEFHAKMKIIPQSINFEEVILNEYKPNKIPTFAYSGSVVKDVCDPRALLDYLSTINTPFLFHIYTNTPFMFERYKEVLGEKLNIRPYKPRFELLKDLSTMDFLVNFKLNNTVQASSKMIDYSLVKRPVLYITYDNMDKGLVNEFLRGDYSRQYKVDNVDQYDTKNVVTQFLSLASR